MIGVSESPCRFGLVSPVHRERTHELCKRLGTMAIYYEQGHKGGIYRSVFLDGRPRLPSHFRQWLGHAIGRWEGDTLVVDTTNSPTRPSTKGPREPTSG